MDVAKLKESSLESIESYVQQIMKETSSNKQVRNLLIHS